MILFQKMSTVTNYSFLTVVLLIWFGTGRQPLATAYYFLRSFFTSRKFMFFFLAMLSILMANKYELKLENWIPVSYDLTHALSGWEGNWQAVLQSALKSTYLTAFCVFFYIVVFQSVMAASIGVYTTQRNYKLFYALCVALLMNYLVALPSYLFLPVNEVWFANPNVKFLMLDAFPTFEQQYRGLSGLNNCFPSLHTSISVTMALIASRSGNRRWAIFSWVNAAIIIFSIFYLGIHWFTDMAAGTVLACVAAAVGLKVGDWADRTSPDANRARSKNSLSASRSVGS
jgi:membrane-associated phospholipid phosphatase